MKRISRRNFLKGLTLSGLGLGLFKFSLKEDGVIELPEIEMMVDEEVSYSYQTPSYVITTFSAGSNSIQTGQLVYYIGSDSTYTTGMAKRLNLTT